ncbi:MAG TPA: thiamine phosphate synthase [Candidatus Binataceae bacterium]|jgi:thiamine-phosphate pyrophosphorylase|nr:thiamine phosphate synthase [Candidatus Binataceae bacterium]
MPRIDFKLYLITDRKLAAARGLVETVEAALQAAAEAAPQPPIAIQLREKNLEGRALIQLAAELKQICRTYRVPILVNGRIDVALAAGADGVHLPSDGIAPNEARKLIGPSKLIGVSTHTAGEITRAEALGADFAVFGPVFAPLSKGTYAAPSGPQALSAACSAASIPVFALGGINAARVPELQSTGAAGVAAIGAIIGARDPAQATRELLNALQKWE